MKSVLVTGGTTRLGRAIAERLRADGWRVLTSSHRPDAGADVVADLSRPDGPARLYAAAKALLGGQPPDALVNNAALYVGTAAATEAINYVAPKELTMLMARRETADRGCVVNILDTRVMNAGGGDGAVSDGRSPYFRAKLALRDDTLGSAEAFADTLRVNGVAPGPVLAPTQVREKAGRLLLERPTAADVAAAVAYLLAAKATTGCVIPVDGGQSLLQREVDE